MTRRGRTHGACIFARRARPRAVLYTSCLGLRGYLLLFEHSIRATRLSTRRIHARSRRRYPTPVYPRAEPTRRTHARGRRRYILAIADPLGFTNVGALALVLQYQRAFGTDYCPGLVNRAVGVAAAASLRAASPALRTRGMHAHVYYKQVKSCDANVLDLVPVVHNVLRPSWAFDPDRIVPVSEQAAECDAGVALRA